MDEWPQMLQTEALQSTFKGMHSMTKMCNTCTKKTGSLAHRVSQLTLYLCQTAKDLKQQQEERSVWSRMYPNKKAPLWYVYVIFFCLALIWLLSLISLSCVDLDKFAARIVKTSVEVVQLTVSWMWHLKGGCNARHMFMGAIPSETNGNGFRVNMVRIGLGVSSADVLVCKFAICPDIVQFPWQSQSKTWRGAWTGAKPAVDGSSCSLYTPRYIWGKEGMRNCPGIYVDGIRKCFHSLTCLFVHM